MKKLIYFFPLLGVSALGHFLLPYWQGRGFVSQQWALLDDFAILLLPFILAGLFAIIAGTSAWKRMALYVVTLMVQYVFLFTLVPGAARSEMIGLAERYRKEFPVNELRTCADKILKMHADGTLVLTNFADNKSFLRQNVVVNPPLPIELAKTFQAVRFSQADESRGTAIYFDLDPQRGIMCTTNRYENDFGCQSMGNGVYAFRYMRP